MVDVGDGPAAEDGGGAGAGGGGGLVWGVCLGAGGDGGGGGVGDGFGDRGLRVNGGREGGVTVCKNWDSQCTD